MITFNFSPTTAEQRIHLKVIQRKMVEDGVPEDLLDRCITTARADQFVYDMLEVWERATKTERLDLEEELKRMLS